MDFKPDLLPGGGSESQEHVTHSQPQPIMVPPGYQVLTNASPPSLISHPQTAGVTTTMQGVCKTCRQIKPIAEFMTRKNRYVLKNCTPCRQKHTLAYNRTRARRDARLDAQIRAQTTQDQNPGQPYVLTQSQIPIQNPVQTQGLAESQIPIQNTAGPQIPLPQYTVVNESNFVISGLLQQRSFTNPCVPGDPSEEAKPSEQTISNTEPPIKSEEKDSSYGDNDDEDGDDETAPTVSTPAFFRCLHCGIARSACLEHSGICIYCFEHELKYCIAGDHEMDRPDFVGADGVEYEDCNGCRESNE